MSYQLKDVVRSLLCQLHVVLFSDGNVRQGTIFIKLSI